MAEPKFKVGDVVMLKSGGLSMTIRSFESGFSLSGETIGYICVWMDSTGVPQEQFYLEDMIELT